MRRLIITPLVVFSLTVSLQANSRWLNLYIPEFDNLRNDPSVAWLSSGFVDILSQKFTELDGVRVFGRPALEKILQDKTVLLTQRAGTDNILVMGTYSRDLDQVTVNAQIINISNWAELGMVRTASSMTNITIMGNDLFAKLSEGLKEHLPPSPKADELYPLGGGYSDAPEMNRQTKEVGESIDQALEGLEKAMDVFIGARGVEKGTVTSHGKFSRELNFGTKETPSGPATKEAMMLEEILELVAANPYGVQIGEPKVEVDPESKGKTVFLSLPVKYSLKENLISDMLRSLPYTGVRQEGTLTTIEFARNKFPISGELSDRITKGEFRVVPVVQFLGQNGKVHTAILDSGDPYWHSQSRKKSNTRTEHIFSQLVAFTVSGWSLQVTMEAVDINATYTVEMPRTEVGLLSQVVVEFVPESNLKKYLSNVL
jgi:TolB-like protein